LKHSQEEINQARRLWKLDKWRQWWKKRGWQEGDWYWYNNKKQLIIDVGFTKLHTLPLLLYYYSSILYPAVDSIDSKDCIPLPSFSDCRKFLREEGIIIVCLSDLPEELEQGMAGVRIEFIDQTKSTENEEYKVAEAPTDKETIMKIIEEVCK